MEDEYIRIEDFSSVDNGFDALIEIDDEVGSSDKFIGNQSFSGFVNEEPAQGQPDAPQQPSVDTPQVDAPASADSVDLADDDIEIIPSEQIDWSAKAASEYEKDMGFFGYKPEAIPDKDSFIILSEQAAYAQAEFNSNQELSSLLEKKNFQPANLLESGIREALGVFATDDEVANKLSNYINEDGSLNETGTRIHSTLVGEIDGKINGIVEKVKADSLAHAHNQVKFYRELEKNVTEFSFEPISFQNDGESVSIGIPIGKADRRSLYEFIQKDYASVVNGENLPDGTSRPRFLAENAFLLNRNLVNKYIATVAQEAYKRGSSDTLKQISK